MGADSDDLAGRPFFVSNLQCRFRMLPFLPDNFDNARRRLKR